MLNSFIEKCHNTLISKNSEEINKAFEYLTKVRGFTEQTIIEHKIGYCSSADSVHNSIRYYGKEKILAGDYGYEGFIKEKIIVPIYEEFGLPTGLATRKPTVEKGSTWWNLPQPFKKSNHLFLLNKTRKNVFDSNKIYLVEGYADALLLYQEGLKNVCSIMGTKLSLRKIGLIFRYCNNICFCMDVDANSAGQEAQNKSVAAIRELGFYESISIIEGLPIGVDPDDFVKKNGIEKFLSMERKLTTKEIESIYKRQKAQNRR